MRPVNTGVIVLQVWPLVHSIMPARPELGHAAGTGAVTVTTPFMLL